MRSKPFHCPQEQVHTVDTVLNPEPIDPTMPLTEYYKFMANPDIIFDNPARGDIQGVDSQSLVERLNDAIHKGTLAGFRYETRETLDSALLSGEAAAPEEPRVVNKLGYTVLTVAQVRAQFGS